MHRYVWLFIAVITCSKSYAFVDIKLACKEKEEQKNSQLTKMSTSMIEANLAGQCTGYNSYHKINLKQACSELIQQKKALLSTLSTSNLEANLAGMCIGAIYRISEQCSDSSETINYYLIAEGATSVKSVKIKLGCNGGYYGR